VLLTSMNTNYTEYPIPGLYVNAACLDNSFCKDSVWVLFIMFVGVIPFDRIVLPLMARFVVDDVLPLIWLRILLETACWFHPILVLCSNADHPLWDWGAGVMMFLSTFFFHGHCLQPFFGVLGGFPSIPLDPRHELVPIPLRTRSLKSVTTSHGGGQPLGRDFYRPSVFIEGEAADGDEPDVTCVVFEPAGRSWPDCFHIRCPEFDGAPALDCAMAKYHPGVETNFFSSLRTRNQKFKINDNGTISPACNPHVALGTNDDSGQLRLVTASAKEALKFSLEVRNGVVTNTLVLEDIEEARALQRQKGEKSNTDIATSLTAKLRDLKQALEEGLLSEDEHKTAKEDAIRAHTLPVAAAALGVPAVAGSGGENLKAPPAYATVE